MTCQKELMAAGGAYPRTCQECGLRGPCNKGYDPKWVPSSGLPLTRKEAPPHQSIIGYALATYVLQSDLYRQLDDVERDECHAFIQAGIAALKTRS